MNPYEHYHSEYPHLNVQNFAYNVNIIQGNNFNFCQPYQQADPSNSYDHQNVFFQNAPMYSGSSMNNEFTVSRPTQPLVETYPNNYMNSNPMSYIKSNPTMNSQHFIPTSHYDNPNNCVNYFNSSFNSVDGDNQNYLDPILRFPPGTLLPTNDFPLDNQPTVTTPAKTHANCSTLKYNRKVTSPSNAPRQYRCSYYNCNKAYLKSSHLKDHVRKHTGERPHKCNFVFPDNTMCSDSFIRSDQLTRHRRKHQGDRPFSCQFCSKAFYRSDHCTTHQERCKRRSDHTVKLEN